MVAFVTALLIGSLGCGAVIVCGRRRPVGAPLTWGQAMAAAAFAFLMFFWWYGVIPNQWLNWADNELRWRSDAFLLQHGQGPFGLAWSWQPLDFPKQTVRDIIVVGIYGLGLTLHIVMWAVWQGRAKERPLEIPASRYGRPLVRKG